MLLVSLWQKAEQGKKGKTNISQLENIQTYIKKNKNRNKICTGFNKINELSTSVHCF